MIMTPQQLQQYRDLLASGRVPDNRLSDTRVFYRGWNEGVDYAERMLRKVLGEPVNTTTGEIPR